MRVLFPCPQRGERCNCCPGWLQERFEQVKGALLPFLRTSGFRESQVQWLPAVGPTGQNLTGPPTEPALSSWWRGPSVVAAIDAFRPAARAVGWPLRMPIADVFKGLRSGVAVGGKLEGGALKVRDRLCIPCHVSWSCYLQMSGQRSVTTTNLSMIKAAFAGMMKTRMPMEIRGKFWNRSSTTKACSKRCWPGERGWVHAS